MVVSDLTANAIKELAGEGAVASSSLDDLVSKLTAPRAAWIMVPSGDATEKTVEALLKTMESGDTIIDGGNSYFKDDVRRSKLCAAKGVNYVDVGTSGGVWGLERGYCMMIGGPKEVVERLDLQNTGSRTRRHLAHSGTRKAFWCRRGHLRRGIHSLRTFRRRAFRQNGPQRDRIRHDAGLRRGLRYF